MLFGFGLGSASADSKLFHLIKGIRWRLKKKLYYSCKSCFPALVASGLVTKKKVPCRGVLKASLDSFTQSWNNPLPSLTKSPLSLAHFVKKATTCDFFLRPSLMLKWPSKPQKARGWTTTPLGLVKLCLWWITIGAIMYI